MERKVEKILVNLANKLSSRETFRLGKEIRIDISYTSQRHSSIIFYVLNEKDVPAEAAVVTELPAEWKNDFEEAASQLMNLWQNEGEGEQYYCYDGNKDYEITIEISGYLKPIHERYGVGKTDKEIHELREEAVAEEKYEMARIWRDVLKSRAETKT